MVRRLLFFVLLATCLILAARVSERYSGEFDLTANRSHSLSESAGRALDGLREPLTLTAYVPELVVQRAELRQLLAPYLAHPSRPRLVFVDPVADPVRARQAGIARHGELHLQSGQRREVIARPSAATLDRALNRLALHGERWIVVLKGHGERPVDATPGGIGGLTGRLEALGYRVVSLDPRHTAQLPDNTALLLIAAPREDYGPAVSARIRAYVDDGGPVWWLLGTATPALVGELLGIGLLPGVVVDAAAADVGLAEPDNTIVSDYPPALLPQPPGGHSVLKGARGLRVDHSGEWQVVGRLQSSPRSWNETGTLTGQIGRDPGRGEQAGPITVGLALQQSTADTRRRVLVMGGDAFVSNDQLGHGDNAMLAVGLTNWLTDNEALTDPVVARDLELRWSPRLAGVLAITLMGVLPPLYLAIGWWLRRRRRQQ